MMLNPSGKVTPFLWFDSQAEEAAKFYVSLVPNSRIVDVNYWAKGSPFPEGSVMSAIFELDGRQYIALNAGPHYKLSPAFSLFVSCEDQAEVDRYWDALVADGGAASQCAWLTDKFGVSWQIVPAAIGELLSSGNAKKSQKVMEAVMQMTKLDIGKMKQAYGQA